MSDQDVEALKENDEKEIPLRFLALENWSEINISLSEYEKLRNKILLTLLRRCGLRVSEVSRLRNIDIIGLSEPRLRVSYSKTRAGKKRMIPLFLLLDNEELEEVVNHFATKQDYIFVDAEKKRLKAAKIGNITQKLLTEAGIKGKTAHGLRHALANALFAAFWIKINEENDMFDKEKWTNFCRSGIEGAAISHLYHIQLIMGHADLRVTFSTYIHLLTIAVFEIVKSSERFQTLENLKLNSAEKLMGIEKARLKNYILPGERDNKTVSFITIENIAYRRLEKIAKAMN